MPLHPLVRSALLLAVLLGAMPARAQNTAPGEPGFLTHTFLWENDNPMGADKHYTNGLRYARAMAAPPLWMHRMRRPGIWKLLTFGAQPCGDAASPSDCHAVRTGFVFGQNLYTPTDITLTRPQPHDRPFGAMLYYGRTFELARGRWQHEMEYDAGLVGPLALGESVQVGWHELTNSWTPRGWQNQLGSGVLIHAILRTHYQLAEVNLSPDTRIELLPRVQLVAGTPFTNARAGAILRLGRNVPRAVAGYIPAAAPPPLAPIGAGAGAGGLAAAAPVTAPADAGGDAGGLAVAPAAGFTPGEPLPDDRAARIAILRRWELEAVAQRQRADRPRHRPPPLYLFLAADVTGVAHNALIQGIPLRSDNPAAPDLERVYTEVQGGLVFHVRGVDLTLRRVWRSGEFEGDDLHRTWTLGVTL